MKVLRGESVSVQQLPAQLEVRASSGPPGSPSRSVPAGG